MKKITLIQLAVLQCVLMISQAGNAQEPQWTRLLQLNTNGFPSVKVVAADAENVYMACSVAGPLTFNDKDYTTIGNADLLVSKMTNDGMPVWDKQFNAQAGGVISANAIKLDGSGNVYLAGTFAGTLTIGGSTIISGTSTNAFMAKLDANGNGVWVTAFQYIGTGSSKIALDGAENIYLLSASAKLLKFDNNGLKLWEQSYMDRTLQAIAVSGRSLYLGGALQQTTAFGSLTLIKAGGYNNGYIVKADLDGVFSASVVAGLAITNDGSAVADIAVNSNGDLILVGGFQGNIQFGDKLTTGNVASSRYTFIAKCNSDLTFAWVKSSSPLTDSYRSIWTYRLFQDNSNNIYEFGMNSCSFTFGSASVTNSTGNQFLVKFDANGNGTNGYALQNASYDRTIVTPTGNTLSAGSNSTVGSVLYGNIYLTQFDNTLTQAWQKVSSNSAAGNAAINNIKHDGSGNTYVMARITGSCDYFGTAVNTTKPATVISKHDITGKLLWMKQFNDISPNLIGHTFALDKDFNVLITGLFKISLDIGTTSLTTTNTGNEGYVAKYGSDGGFIWARTVNLGTNVSTVITVSSDMSGNVLVAGVISPANYLVKFDGSGNRLWAKSFPMESNYFAAVSTDAANNIYLASEIHLDNSTGTVTIGTITLNQSATDGASALIKFDPDGNALWAKTYGAVTGAAYTDGWPGDVINDSEGNTYMYGWCPNNATFGTTVLTNPLNTGSVNSLYLTKINTLGDVLWAKAVYQKMSTYGYGDLLDLDKNGNIYLGGHFKDKINIEGNEFTPAGTTEFFAAKFSNSGVFQWLKTIPANPAITAISVMDINILSVAGNPGKNTMLGTLNVTQKSGSNCIIATLVKANALSGHISDYASNPVTTGFVKLYKLNGNMAATQVDSVAIQADGSYAFQNVPELDFILYAEPGSLVYPNYTGTYSGNAILWTAAKVLNYFTSVQSDYTIKLNMIAAETGSGLIKGTVSYDISFGGKSKVAAGVPVKSVPVILVDKNVTAGSDSIVAVVKTNSMGEYVFVNVPAGNYSVRVEIPGLGMIEMHGVELTAAKPDAEKMNYLVTNTGIIIDDTGVTGIKNRENAGISISPNPAKSTLFISGITRNSIIAVFDLNGQMLMNKQIDGNYIDISTLAKGIYTLKISDKNGVTTRKLVKQ